MAGAGLSGRGIACGDLTGSPVPQAAHQDVTQQNQFGQDEECDDVGPVEAARENEPGEDESGDPQQPDSRRRQVAFARI